ncbi:hypothetical protein [Tenacibaculum sp. 190524A02b]|uniref:tRNA_anti-like n=1 Tax=Tenacibaculum vairaonense TaxID=3137860 RepID=A0ABM9PH63_9FLAO
MSLTKKSKWLFIILGILLIGGFLVYKQIYKPHKTTEEIEAIYTGSSTNFVKELEKGFDQWNNKTIELNGTITSIVDNGFILDDFIFCQLREDNTLSKKQNDQITVKGTVIGYDELLNELKLNQCIIK